MDDLKRNFMNELESRGYDILNGIDRVIRSKEDVLINLQNLTLDQAKIIDNLYSDKFNITTPFLSNKENSNPTNCLPKYNLGMILKEIYNKKNV